MIKKIFFSALLIVGSASSASSRDYSFTLNNRSQGWVISGFYTFQDGQWSSNWLQSRVRAGSSMPLEWNSNSGACVVPFRVQCVDYGSQDFSVNWCTRNIRNLNMLNEGFSVN